jgi:hypothetical protein
MLEDDLVDLGLLDRAIDRLEKAIRSSLNPDDLAAHLVQLRAQRDELAAVVAEQTGRAPGKRACA